MGETEGGRRGREKRPSIEVLESAPAVLSTVLVGLVLLALLAGMIWAAYTIVTGIPDPVQEILKRNYFVVVIAPAWAVLSWIGIYLAAKSTAANSRDTFSGKAFGLEFSGGGGPAIVWAFTTVLGFLVLASKWQ